MNAPRKKPQARRPKSAALLEVRRKAKKEGWLKWVRKGEGEQADELAMLSGCRIDQRRGDHVTQFFEKFGVLTEGAWKGHRFRLLPWQHEWLFRAFSWVRDSEEWKASVRRFRYLYLETPKKNGKTPLTATIGNYLLLADHAEKRQVSQYLAATTRKQAERCLIHAVRAYKYNPTLRSLVNKKKLAAKKLEGFLKVEYKDNTWEVLAADPTSSEGINGHILAEELHKWVGFEFYNGLRYALATQPEGLFVGITNADNNPDGVCRMCYEKTTGINSGRTEDSQWFGQIYAAESSDDLDDEATWRKANPSLGTNKAAPLKLTTFRADYESARDDPVEWNSWIQKRLGIRRDATDSWLDIDLWDLGPDKRKPRSKKQQDCYGEFGPEDVQGWKCVVALDGATTRDTTAAVFTFEHPENEGELWSLPYFWLPRNRAEQLGSKTRYRRWSELTVGPFDQKMIVLTEGDAVDFDWIYADLCKLIKFFSPQALYFDPYFQAEWITQKLENETGVERRAFPQTMMHYSPCMKHAERLVRQKRARHNGNQCFTWQLGNTKRKPDVNANIRPIKQKHGDYKTVDGPVAWIMSMSYWLQLEFESFYDKHELESN